MTLIGTFGAGDDAATDARIQLNESTIWESLDFTTDQAFSLTQDVDENDTIDWVVSGAWNDGNNASDGNGNRRPRTDVDADRRAGKRVWRGARLAPSPPPASGGTGRNLTPAPDAGWGGMSPRAKPC